jgi:UDP-N-acetyl-D-galactosamine dehydrogenase
MPLHVADRVVQLMAKKRLHVNGARILVMGVTFKENCPDSRNSKVVDVIHELERHGAHVDTWDPWADPKVVQHEYGIKMIPAPKQGRYDVIVMAVAHEQFRKMGIRAVKRLAKPRHVLFDIKHVFKASQTDGRL